MAEAPKATKPQTIMATIDMLETDLHCIETSLLGQQGNPVKLSTPHMAWKASAYKGEQVGAYEGKTGLARKRASHIVSATLRRGGAIVNGNNLGMGAPYSVESTRS
jgi:hypothetical protein